MGKISSLAGGLGIGAALMYLLDPDRGNGRRTQLRDQIQGSLRSKRDALDVMSRDFTNRMRGMSYEARAKLRREPVPDEVLVQRVRSEIGRWVTHAGSIDVTCQNGTVTLAGPILADEVQAFIATVRKMAGVRSVINLLQVHEGPEGIPGLQGQGRLPDMDRWTPATAMAYGIGGAMLAVWGLSKRGPLGTLIGIAGIAVVSKSFSDTERRFESSDKARQSEPVPSEEGVGQASMR